MRTKLVSLFHPIFVITVLVLFFLSACSPRARRSTSDEPPFLHHTVSYNGETLALIARWYTGRSENWVEILEYNPDLDVRRMRIGTDVRIPTDLLVVDDPMPRRFVEKSNALINQASASTDSMPHESMGQDGAQPEATLQPLHADSNIQETNQEPEVAKVLAPPEKTFPRAGNGAITGDSNESAPSTKSRDELLEELLQE